jgi:hypothetical protein
VGPGGDNDAVEGNQAELVHAASTPGTAWPVLGHPPGSSRRDRFTIPGFDATSFLNDASTATPSEVTPAGHFLVRLPGPHLTHLVRRFPEAHHDGLPAYLPPSTFVTHVAGEVDELAVAGLRGREGLT